MGGVSGKEVQRVVIVTGFRWARERLKGGGDLGVWGLHWRRRCTLEPTLAHFFIRKCWFLQCYKLPNAQFGSLNPIILVVSRSGVGRD